MKMDQRSIEPAMNAKRCSYTCIPTFRKDFYSKIKMNKHLYLKKNNKKTFCSQEVQIVPDEIIKDKSTLDVHPTPSALSIASAPVVNSSSALHKNQMIFDAKPVDLLHMAYPHISHDLISTKNFEIIKNFTELFTNNITSFFGFECRLAETAPHADFAFAVSGRGNDRFNLKNVVENSAAIQQLLSHQEWQRILDFTLSWSDTESVLYNKVKCFWIEFDTAGNNSDIPIPSVFFGPAKPSRELGSNNPDQYDWLISSALPLLKGKISNEIHHNLFDCISKIPLNSYVFQVGTMLSREPQNIRLFINKIEADQIIPYLLSIGWEEDPTDLITVIQEIDQFVDRYVISFDVTEQGVGQKIGIECSFDGEPFDAVPQWQEFLNYLVDKGLCLPEKRDALLSYSGVDNTTMFTKPVEPLVSASSTKAYESCSSARFINHIKLVYRPEKPLEAKAYPAIRYYCPAETTSQMKQE